MTKKQFLGKSDLLKPKTHRIELGEGYVLIKPLTASYALSLRGKTLADEDFMELISLSLCDESGAPVLTKEEVGQMDISILNQIAVGILEFNGIGQDAIEKAKEELKQSPTEGQPSKSL